MNCQLSTIVPFDNIVSGMTVTEAELASLAASHDIISLGMLADEARRARHGTRTTFVRVADVSSEPGAPMRVSPGRR